MGPSLHCCSNQQLSWCKIMVSVSSAAGTYELKKAAKRCLITCRKTWRKIIGICGECWQTYMISHMNPEYCNCHWWISAVTYYYIYSLQITHFFSTSSRLAFHSFPYRCAFISWWYFVEFEFNHTLHLKMISCLKNLLWKSLTFNTIGTGAACMILHTVIWEYIFSLCNIAI